MQAVVLWDLEQGRLLGVVGPADGGCSAFAVTPDARTVVAVAGPWKEGVLLANQLVTYDVSELIGGKAAGPK